MQGCSLQNNPSTKQNAVALPILVTSHTTSLLVSDQMKQLTKSEHFKKTSNIYFDTVLLFRRFWRI